jgi:hypothetical protein
MQHQLQPNNHSNSSYCTSSSGSFRQKKPHQLLTTENTQQLRYFQQNQYQQRQLQQYGATPEPASGTAAPLRQQHHLNQQVQKAWSPRNYKNNSNNSNNSSSSNKSEILASAASRLDHYQQVATATTAPAASAV